jgi:hypothetical protein
MFAAGRSSAPAANALTAATSLHPPPLPPFPFTDAWHAEPIPSFGFDSSAAQLPAVPNSNPVKDTAAARLASTLDSRASDDSGSFVSSMPLLGHEQLIRMQNLHGLDVNGRSAPKRIRAPPIVHRDRVILNPRLLNAVSAWPASMSCWAQTCPPSRTRCECFGFEHCCLVPHAMPLAALLTASATLPRCCTAKRILGATCRRV